MPYGRARSVRRRHHVKRSGGRKHHRRRIGAVAGKGQLLTTLLAAGAGGLIGRKAADWGASFLPASMSAKTQGLIKAAALGVGGVLVAFYLGRKYPIARGFGAGLFVEGVHQGAQTLGFVSGVGRVDPASLVFPQGAKVGNYYALQNRGAVAGGTNFPRPATVGGHRRPSVSVMGGM